jgi:hypothetical protein
VLLERRLERAHPVVLVVEPLVESLEPGGELAVERAEAGREAIEGGGDPGRARVVKVVEPLAYLLQRGGRAPLLGDVVLHRAGEQFAHPVGGRVLPGVAVVAGRAGLAGAQQQLIVARLVHRAPSSSAPGEGWSGITLVAQRGRPCASR